MPVCLKCGWEIVIGPGGCACTQDARRKHEMEEAAKAGEELAKKLGPILDEARSGRMPVAGGRRRRPAFQRMQEYLKASKRRAQREGKAARLKPKRQIESGGLQVPLSLGNAAKRLPDPSSKTE